MTYYIEREGDHPLNDDGQPHNGAAPTDKQLASLAAGVEATDHIDSERARFLTFTCVTNHIHEDMGQSKQTGGPDGLWQTCGTRNFTGESSSGHFENIDLAFFGNK